MTVGAYLTDAGTEKRERAVKAKRQRGSKLTPWPVTITESYLDWGSGFKGKVANTG